MLPSKARASRCLTMSRTIESDSPECCVNPMRSAERMLGLLSVYRSVLARMSPLDCLVMERGMAELVVPASLTPESEA